MAPQISRLEGATINVKGRQLRLKIFALFDLCALNAVLGKQGSSATYFDPWTNVRLDHIRNHKNKAHTPEYCKEIAFVCIQDLEKNFTHHTIDSKSKKSGQHFGSVTGGNIVPLPDIFRYACPLMHIVMGLGNSVFNELKRAVRDLDSGDKISSKEKELRQTQNLKILHDEKEELDIIFSNYNLDKMILINDRERVSALLNGKTKEAEKIAHSNYKHSAIKKQRVKCDNEMCLVFPIDEKKGYAEKIECEKTCVIHLRCEGLIFLDGEELPENYTCKSCTSGNGNKEWLDLSIENGIQTFTHEIQKISVRLTQLKMKIEMIEEDEYGAREKKLMEACKKLNLNPARYHGGDFEGKAIQRMLDCARNGKYELLDCIKDKPKLFEKFKRAISTLQEVSDSLRRSWDEFDDDEIEIVQKICTRWGEHWTKDFPHLNITPKAHDLIFVIPEFLRRTRTFHMFYKFEERSESIHADLNTIQRKIWCIRQPEQRLWKFIERLVIFF